MRGNVHGGKVGSKKDRICLGVHITEETHTRLLEIAKKQRIMLKRILQSAKMTLYVDAKKDGEIKPAAKLHKLY